MEKDGSIINREDGIDPKELEDYKLVRHCSRHAGYGLLSFRAIVHIIIQEFESLQHCRALGLDKLHELHAYV